MPDLSRRSFLGITLGGIVGAAAVRAWPFRVYNFPSEIVQPSLAAQSIRFIRAYDTQENFACRFDVLYGSGQLSIPDGVELAEVLSAPSGSLSKEDMQNFASKMMRRFALNDRNVFIEFPEREVGKIYPVQRSLTVNIPRIQDA
jgi:hypothetical protein